MEICILKDQENIQQILFEFKKDLFQKTISSSKLKELSLKFSKSAVFMTISKGGNQIIGYAAFYCNDLSAYKAFLSMIVIKNQYHHHGFGTKLLKEVCTYARNMNMRNIGLEVAKGNDNALHFYLKYGFLKCKETGDTYLLEKRLT